jgi:FkbM family methyltransferase
MELLKDTIRRSAPRLYGQLKHRFGRDAFLRNVSGLIHVGANVGQERALYDSYALDVIWVEPVPEAFAKLQTNIAHYTRQRAFQYLLADCDGPRRFHLASNDCASSSLFDLGRNRELYPEITFERTLTLPATTLNAMMGREGIDPRRYRALMIDTQGSELMVLRGATALLPHLRYIRSEAADAEFYSGGCTDAEISAFLWDYGFRETRRDEFARLEPHGAYFDILYEKADCPENEKNQLGDNYE